MDSTDKSTQPTELEAQSEALLTAWLRLSSVINNQRLMKALPFNEAVVCNLLYSARRHGQKLTATDLCDATHILKSQMNSILMALEKKDFIVRRQSQEDRRRVEVEILPQGVTRYKEAHRPILELIVTLTQALGPDQVEALIPSLNRVTETFISIQKEN